MDLFKRDWRKVQAYIGSRSGAQIRSHAQKFFTRLEKEAPGGDVDTYIASKASALRQRSVQSEIKNGAKEEIKS